MKISREKALALIASIPLREESEGVFKGMETYALGGLDGYDVLITEWHTLRVKGAEYEYEKVVFREGGH